MKTPARAQLGRRYAGHLNQVLEQANKQRALPPAALTLLDDLLAKLEAA